MRHIYLKFLFAIFLPFAAALLLIRAQPYDDRDIKAVLIPEACDMPCFMGIKPGVTTVDEAVKILEASGWVNRGGLGVTSRYNVVRVEWNWNGLQPALFKSGASAVAVATILPGFNEDESLDDQERVITGISVITTIPYGATRLLLGRGENKPDYIVSKSYINPRITAVYSDDGLVILSTVMSCPVSLSRFWSKTVALQIGYTFVDDIVHVCRGMN